jgi:hypothetical protein
MANLPEYTARQFLPYPSSYDTSQRCNFKKNNITVISRRFDFDATKSQKLRSNPQRGIGFEEAQEIFSRPYYLDQRSDLPEQYRAIGWVGQRL